MLTYLAIGLVVQLLITFERACVRKVVPELTFDGWFDVASFVITLILGGFINIVVWPLTIVAEVFNIKRGA